MAVLYYFREPETLYDCVSFKFRLLSIVCCNGFFEHGGRFFINKWTRICSLFCACLAVVGLSGAIYALLQNELLREQVLQLDKLFLTILGLEVVISTLVFIITVLSLQAWAHRQLSIYKRLAVIDRSLVDDFGVNLNYAKLMRKNIIVLTTVSILYLVAVNTVMVCFADGHNFVFVMTAALCYSVITGGPHLTCFAHMILAEVLSIRFRLLQKILKPQLLYRQFGKDQLIERRVRMLVNIVKEQFYIIEEINEVYSLSLWSAMAHDFTLGTCELYIIFGRSVGNSDIISNTSSSSSNDSEDNLSLRVIVFLSGCMVVLFYKMSIGPVYCNRTVEEGRKCMQLLEQLDNWFPGRPAIKQLVESTMRWRLQFKIEFTSGTNTVLNKSIITLYTSVVCNYLLVLISFAMTQKLGEQVEHQKDALQDWIGF